jgi:hypothetical protein
MPSRNTRSTPRKAGAAPRKAAPKLVQTVNTWADAHEVLRQFLEAHPELGIRFSTAVAKHFCRIYGPQLREAGVMRKSFERSPWIADAATFDAPAFEALTNRRKALEAAA